MKKILFLLLTFVSLCVNAQIYNNKKVLDKFDDVISERTIKTLIQKTDSTFVIEEKGSKPVTYKLIENKPISELGDKDNIVNLVSGVFGYEKRWAVVLPKDYTQYLNEREAIREESDVNKRDELINKTISKYVYFIIHRVVTTQFTNQYLNEMFWIQKGENNGRTIYFIN